MSVPRLTDEEINEIRTLGKERVRYKCERDELLRVLFQALPTRNAVAKRILGETDPQQVNSPESLRESDGSRGKALGDQVGR